MTSTSIVVTATFVPRPGKRFELLDLFDARLPSVQDEPGCELCSVQEAENGTLLMIEKWSSTESWKTHLSDGAFAGSETILAPLLSEPVVIVPYVPIPIGDALKGVL